MVWFSIFYLRIHINETNYNISSFSLTRSLPPRARFIPYISISLLPLEYFAEYFLFFFFSSSGSIGRPFACIHSFRIHAPRVVCCCCFFSQSSLARRSLFPFTASLLPMCISLIVARVYRTLRVSGGESIAIGNRIRKTKI